VNTGSIQCVFCEDADISHNSILNWVGLGIDVNAPAPTTNNRITYNYFGPVGDPTDDQTTAINCVACQNMTTGFLTIIGNVIRKEDGTGPRVGLNMPITTTRPYISHNDFVDVINASYRLPESGFARGDGIWNAVTTGNDTMPDVSGCTVGFICHILINPTGDITITDFKNGSDGIVLMLSVLSAHTVEFTRANAYLKDGANWTGNFRDTLILMSLGGKWKEIARSGDNG
jgi:hypothetical protein